MSKFNANEGVDVTKLEKLFLENGTLKTFRRNDYMVHQNNKTNHIGYVTSGTFRLTRIDTNGNEWIVGYSFENDFVCDYPSLINRTSATVSIKATTSNPENLLSTNLENKETRKQSFNTRNNQTVAPLIFFVAPKAESSSNFSVDEALRPKPKQKKKKGRKL